MRTMPSFRAVVTTAYRVLNILVILGMILSTTVNVAAFTWTEPTDFSPGSTVTIRGNNTDADNLHNWVAGEIVHVDVVGPNGYTAACEGLADAMGGWSCDVVLWNDLRAVGQYDYTATGLSSGNVETGMFTDAPPSIQQLWQCDPPAVFDKNTYTCVSSGATGWVSGNDDGPFAEGETVPYRTRFQNLVKDNQYSITIQWDTTKAGKHAIDYLKTFNATIVGADPCASLTGLPAGLCDVNKVSTAPIPEDTFMTGDADWKANSGEWDLGDFTMYGGNISGVGVYTNPSNYDGDTSTSITINFTANGSDAVLAWGGHIAERDDWGENNSAVAIPGSPYHMRILTWFDITNGYSLNTGNTDRSLSAEAVIYPGSITIIKQATPEGSQVFPFTAGPSPLVNFNLVDDGTSANTMVFPNIMTFTTYSVTENTPQGWSLTGASCSVTSPNGGSQAVSGATATINLKEGENVTCTYNNLKNWNYDLTVSKTASASFGRTYKWLIDKMVDKTQINIAEGGTATFNYSVKVTPNGYTDSSWLVTGKITVDNPNAFSVAGVNVSDAIDNGGTCAVTGGTNVTVPAKGSVQLDYTCTYPPSGPSTLAGTNTATATWDNAQYYTPNGSASGTAGVDFSKVTPSETNKIITVVDDKTDPQNPVTLGTWNWADGEKIFTYSLNKQGVAGKCTEYTNTASITETKQSDSQKVTVCVGKDLTVSKTAVGSKDRLYKWLIDKSVDDTRIEIAEGGTATFNYSVLVTPNGFTDSAYTLGGTITVNNPNEWEDVTVDVADTLDKGGTCAITEAAPYIVPKNGSLTLHYTCTTDGTTTANNVTVSWDKAAYFTPNGSAADSKPVSFAIGKETNKTITVVDDKTDPLHPVTLGTWNFADGAHTFTYSLQKQGVAGKCTDYTNTASIVETKQSDKETVTVCVGKDLTVSKTAAGTFNRTYLWDISKDVDKTSVNIAAGGTATFNYTVKAWQTGITDAGWTLAGEITITNPNDWEAITLTSLADVVDNGGSCTVAAGPYIVAKSGSLKVAYTCSYGTAPSNLSGINTATATWDKAAAFTPSGSASGNAQFTLNKLGETNKTIHVTDSFNGDLGTVTATDVAPFAQGEFMYSRTVSGVGGTCTAYDNTATITETGKSDKETVKVCVGLDLTVSKTAAGTFDRTYKWLIDKSVDDTLIEIAAGGKATFNYTVKVTPDGYVDSGWRLGGTITVSNPNDWEAITADVTDMYDGGGSCNVLGGEDVVIPAGKSVTLGYRCEFTGQPKYTGINTATAAWDKAAFFTPTGSASGKADVTLTLKGETNRVITVMDDKTDPLNPVTLGTSDFYAGPFEFKYALDKMGVAGTCTDYTNIATIKETGASDNQKVTVCVGVDLTVSKTADGLKDRAYHWTLDKSVDDTRIEIAEGGKAIFNYTVKVTPNGIVDSNWRLSGTITITNPNDWEAVTVDVADTLDKGGTCKITEVAPYIVPKAGSLTLHYTCTTDGTTTKNIATVTWDKGKFFTPGNTATNDAAVTFAIDKETNRVITVMDDKTTGAPIELGKSDYYTGPFEYKYALEKTGVAGTCTDYTNNASIKETKDSDTVTVTVCVGKDLTVSKTAAGTFDRTYNWLIDKMVDRTHVDAYVGEQVTFNYTVKVTPNGSVDSNWRMGGTITVTNPNDWEAITADVTDKFDGGGSCTVLGGEDVVIPAGQSVTLGYRCTFASKPNYTGKNVATAAWDKALYFTPSGMASGEAAVELKLDKEINKTITVVDDKTDPANPVTLGTATWTDGVKTFTYALVKTAAVACQGYTNTAKIVETGQFDKVTVEVCGSYWAFTPGFWKNHTASDPSGHDAWQYTAYTTDQLVGQVFKGAALTEKPRGTTKSLADFTLLEALSFKGGSGLAGAKQILLRAGVAALLNASFHETFDLPGVHPAAIVGPNGSLINPDNGLVYFPYNSDKIIELVKNACNSGDTSVILALAAELDGYNNGYHTIDWSWPVP